MTLQYGVMLSHQIPGRPATPHTFSHLTDTSVASSRSGVVAGSLGPPGVASRTKANLLQPHCSRGENRLKNSHHRTAAASHTERLESASRVNCSVGIVASTSGKGNFKGPKRQFASDLGVEEQQKGLENPPEAGILPDALVSALDTNVEEETKAERRATNAAASTSGSLNAAFASNGGILFHPSEQSQIKESWKHLMRWSRAWRTVEDGTGVLKDIDKVVVFGGGSFGTAIACALARQKGQLNVTLLLRDPYVCKDINERHINSRYLKEYTLPNNVLATTSFVEAIQGAQYAIHAVPVQHSRKFLESIADVLPPDVPIISVSKGLEVGTGKMMSELIPSALGRKQPAAFLSGPSFAKEIMDLRPTGVVAASKDKKLARELQCLFASPYLRVNTTADVIGVEICGALKNVLALAAGIVEGLDLGHNAMAALVAQGCAEIRWLAEKMGAKPATVSGLSGLGDIMLTCYGSLSRNRSVGVRLGKGEALADILASSNQVAEGVSTAGVVVGLARTYRVSLPVLTAVAQVLAGALSPKEAVYEIMNLPQIEEH